MNRQQRLDKLMAMGLGDYTGPAYTPSAAPYLDDFTLGENGDAPVPGPFPWKVYAPLIAIGAIAFILSQAR